MRVFLIIILIISSFASIWAQESLQDVQQTRIFSLSSYYQTWDIADNRSVDEISTPVFLYLPFGYNFNLSLHANRANVSGDDVQGIGSFTDTQLMLTYHIEKANLFLSLGINLPSGKKELTVDEFISSSLISYSVFRFRVPNFGEGFGFAPGITWAIPLSDNVVAGLGATYQRRNAFKPLAVFPGEYEPGDEMLATAGMDFRLTPTATLSTDLTFSSYRADKIAGFEIFNSGNKLTFNLQFRKFFDFNELWFFASYRSRAKNQLVQAGALVEESEKTTPNQFEFMAHYRMRFRRNLHFRILAEGRFFEETSSPFSGAKLLGLGIMPEIAVSRLLTIPVRLMLYSGSLLNETDLSGFEVSIGTELRF